MKERKNFVEAIVEENNQRKTLTENGAVAYETSGKELLDFNFRLTQYRNMGEEGIKRDFSAVFFEDPMIAIKFVFYVGDVRGGLGERKVFNACFDWLVKNKPEVAVSLLDLIPEYTRWDNLCRLASDRNMNPHVIEIITGQLSEDITNMTEGKSISLLAKWMPSINTSSRETVELAKFICKCLGWTPKQYRKTLAKLRKYLDVVEVNISANAWDKVDYEKVPSLANLKYKNAFLKHDWDRRIEYLGELSNGSAKINASVAQPHEIVRNYMSDAWLTEDATLEEMWKSLPDIQIKNTLVVRDGSGSMRRHIGNGKTTCLDVATALAIYCSEHNSDIWKDNFITFSRKPKFVSLAKCKSLRDKIRRCNDEAEMSNTDIEATMELILRTAIKNEMMQEDMPENILIISDMQFDPIWNQFNWNSSIFDEIARDYARYGYKLPRIIFWNVDALPGRNTIPMQNNELGLILCSGFSTTNMKMFMSGEVDPYKVLIEQINNERYDVVGERVLGLI